MTTESYGDALAAAMREIMRLDAENDQIKALNAELVAALQEIVKIGAKPDRDVEDRRLKRDQMWSIARESIKKAESQS